MNLLKITLKVTLAISLLINSAGPGYALRPMAYQCQGVQESHNQPNEGMGFNDRIRREVEALAERLSDNPIEKQKEADDIVDEIHLVGPAGRIIISLVRFLQITTLSILAVRPYFVVALFFGFTFSPKITTVLLAGYFSIFTLLSYLMFPAVHIKNLGIYINKNLQEDMLIKYLRHELAHHMLSCHSYLAETAAELRALEREGEYSCIYMDVFCIYRDTPLDKIEEKLKQHIKIHDKGIDSWLFRIITVPGASEQSWSFSYGSGLAHAIFLLCCKDFNKAYAAVRNMAKGDSLVEALKKVGITKVDEDKIEKYRQTPITEFNPCSSDVAQLKSGFSPARQGRDKAEPAKSSSAGDDDFLYIQSKRVYWGIDDFSQWLRRKLGREEAKRVFSSMSYAARSKRIVDILNDEGREKKERLRIITGHLLALGIKKKAKRFAAGLLAPIFSYKRNTPAKMNIDISAIRMIDTAA